MKAQFLDRSPRYATQSFSLIYILNEECRLLMVKLDPIRNHRRRLRLSHDLRTDITFALGFGNACHIVKDIHQIYAPQAFRRQLRRDKEVFVIQHRRLHELRPYIVDKFILYQFHYRAVPVRYLLGYAFSTLSSLCRIEYHQSS